jgi:hypothetical protein
MPKLHSPATALAGIQAMRYSKTPWPAELTAESPAPGFFLDCQWFCTRLNGSASSYNSSALRLLEIYAGHSRVPKDLLLYWLSVTPADTVVL